MAVDKDGKLTFQMKTPGEAWMDHVNNDLNAKAVTPAYLEPDSRKGAGVSKIDKRIRELEKQQDTVALDKSRAKSLNEPDKKQEKGISFSR